MIIPTPTIHHTKKHIPIGVRRLTNETIKTFRKSNLLKANPADQVGLMIGYDVIKTDLNCGGFCDYTNKRIAFSDTPDLKTMFHEVGHALQAKEGLFEQSNSWLMSHRLNVEWQAETIAYWMYSELVDKNIQVTDFSAYFRMRDVIFLKEWYGSYVEFDEPDIKLKTQ
jgi:hypothetical protein